MAVFVFVSSTSVNAECPQSSWSGIVDVLMPDARNFMSAGLRLYPGEKVRFSLADPGAKANINQYTARRRSKSDVVSCFSGCPHEDYVVPNITTVSDSYPVEVSLWSGSIKSASGQLVGATPVEISVPFQAGFTPSQATQPFEPKAYLPTANHTPCPSRTCSSGSFAICAVIDESGRVDGLSKLLRSFRIEASTFFDANLLNESLREQLGETVAGKTLADAIATQVAQRHSNASSKPEGPGALQYLQFGLSIDSGNRRLLDLITQYYLNRGDLNQAAGSRLNQFNLRIAQMFTSPPAQWSDYQTFIEDSILGGVDKFEPVSGRCDVNH
ncbi:MAG: hypothetical protein ACOYLK_09585, partial [Sphingomonas sp.]